MNPDGRIGPAHKTPNITSLELFEAVCIFVIIRKGEVL
jgi:hypothetical protein